VADPPSRLGKEGDPADYEPEQRRRYDDDEYGVGDDLDAAHPIEDERLRALPGDVEQRLGDRERAEDEELGQPAPR
jgi:hypothetical protein